MLDNIFGTKRNDENRWSKEKQHAHYQRLRQQLESGQLDGKPRPKPWPLTVLGVILIVVAFGLGVSAILQYNKIKQGGDWPGVAATLTSTRVFSHWDDKRNHTDYEIGGIYTYAVGGHTYEYNTTVGWDTTRSGAEDNARRLIGQHMTLYYDPSHPNIALPVPGAGALTIVLAVAAGLTLVAGIFFFMTGGQLLRLA